MDEQIDIISFIFSIENLLVDQISLFLSTYTKKKKYKIDSKVRIFFELIM
jgi:hypothetical protein